ncbi:MAG: hypothetical protein P4L43_00040 [Syntrophobacteraceae bacterium]|nr:hypothetical protein [Syntrophobacteraceae bacterium]
MVETRQMKQKKKKKSEKEAEASPNAAGTDKKKQLQQLDNFIEGVLQEAGEEFLEEFKQVEGQ